MVNWYRLLMDGDRNPLNVLPLCLLFQALPSTAAVVSADIATGIHVWLYVCGAR